MANSGKVIILDLDKLSADYLVGIAAVVLGLGLSYWVITKE